MPGRELMKDNYNGDGRERDRLPHTAAAIVTVTTVLTPGARRPRSPLACDCSSSPAARSGAPSAWTGPPVRKLLGKWGIVGSSRFRLVGGSAEPE